MSLEELRDDIAKKQKKGLPFMGASVIIWLLISLVTCLKLPIEQQNIFIFCCSAPLIPLAWGIGKMVDVNIFEKSNELSSLAFLFTMNQLLYLLIVMWVFNAVPEKMIMVYAMVFGGHLLPFSWLYKSKNYLVFSILIPILALILGNFYYNVIVAITMIIVQIFLVVFLSLEIKKTK